MGRADCQRVRRLPGGVRDYRGGDVSAARYGDAGGDGAGIVYGAAGDRQPAGRRLRGPVALEADDDRKRPGAGDPGSGFPSWNAARN